MNKPQENGVKKAVDSIQERLTHYACELDYADLSAEAIQAAKIRIIDTLGVLMCAFFEEPGRIARNLAAEMPDPNGATVIGTRLKTTPDMAAFVNGTTQRGVELTDTYHWPGSYGGHPSDVVTPVFSAAEYVQASGRDLITSLILAYEVHLRFNDRFHNTGFDHTNFACLATAIATGKLMRLTPEQMSHCISMAVVPNVSLRQSRSGHRSMWKVAATGQAGRAGIFAALLARAGMEGPHLPFEGKSGWLDHVARERFTLDAMGGKDTRFKILDTSIKLRPSSGLLIAPVFAAEKIAPLNIKNVKHITVEVYKKGLSDMGEHQWHPETPQSASRSIPYVVASVLRDGTVRHQTYNEANLKNAEMLAVMKTIEVKEDEEFTKAYGRVPVEHRSRVSVEMNDGQRLVGETGAADNLAGAKSDEQITEKFKGLAEDLLGAKRIGTILERLWSLEKVANVNEIPPSLVVI